MVLDMLTRAEIVKQVEAIGNVICALNEGGNNVQAFKEMNRIMFSHRWTVPYEIQEKLDLYVGEELTCINNSCNFFRIVQLKGYFHDRDLDICELYEIGLHDEECRIEISDYIECLRDSFWVFVEKEIQPYLIECHKAESEGEKNEKK